MVTQQELLARAMAGGVGRTQQVGFGGAGGLLPSPTPQIRGLSTLGSSALQTGTSTAPTAGPLDALARALTGVAGGFLQKKAIEAQRDQQTQALEQILSATQDDTVTPEELQLIGQTNPQLAAALAMQQQQARVASAATIAEEQRAQAAKLEQIEAETTGKKEVEMLKLNAAALSNAVRTLSTQEKVANGFAPDAIVQVDANGQFDVVQEGVDTTADFDDETTLRKEFTKESGAFKEVATSFSNITKSLQEQSPFGDLSATFGFAKMIDPESVVREGEKIVIEKAGSLPQNVVQAIQRVNTGESLTPTQRRDLLTTANEVFSTHAEQQQGRVATYTGIAERNNLDIEDVVVTIAETLPFTADEIAAMDLGTEVGVAGAVGQTVENVLSLGEGGLPEGVPEGSTPVPDRPNVFKTPDGRFLIVE